MKRCTQCLFFSTLSLTCSIGDAVSADGWTPLSYSIPLAFVENRGQWRDSVLFVARQQSMTAHLKADGITLQLCGGRARNETVRASIRTTFEGASTAVTVEGEGKQPGYHNFFFKNDPSKWRTRVPGFSSIRYRGLYDGIDLRVRVSEGSTAGLIEYDVLVNGTADPRQLVMRCEGIDSPEAGHDGSLLVHTEHGTLRQPPATTWQVLPSGERRMVECTYLIVGSTSFGFAVREHDPGCALVIDPRLEWSSFL